MELVCRPIAVLFTPLALLSTPIALAPVAEARLPEATATLRAPLAVAPAPAAVARSPVAEATPSPVVFSMPLVVCTSAARASSCPLLTASVAAWPSLTLTMRRVAGPPRPLPLPIDTVSAS